MVEDVEAFNTFAIKKPNAVTAAKLRPAFHQIVVSFTITPKSRKFLYVKQEKILIR